MRRLPRRLRLRLPSHALARRLLLGAVLVTAVLVPAGLWLRDSSLVSVEEVAVTGASGPQTTEIRQALEDAAREMTTLHVDDAALEDAVRRFPEVAGVTADAELLHRLEIRVHQRLPVAALASGDRRMAVAGDGTMLAGTATDGLPVVPVAAPPGGRSVAEPKARRMVALLAAAPRDLLSRISAVAIGQRGLTARIADGPELYFGTPTRLPAKWTAATRVLGDAAARGATYLDVRVPQRPAAGDLEPTAPTAVPVNPEPQVEPLQ